METTLKNLVDRLLELRTPGGWWEGHLASSALSTATAIGALSLAAPEDSRARELTGRALQWLAAHQNSDGGWGDTTNSLSNISTTSLCWAVFDLAAGSARYSEAVRRAEAWLERTAGGLDAHSLREAISARYGKDRTFSVPILTVLALAGKLGAGGRAWRCVPQLPFELAACPHEWFRWLRLPVVSYALPALIAIGQARHANAPSPNLLARFVRNQTTAATLDKLSEIQPSSGGYLEAVPLTSFVVMSLVAAGRGEHVVARRGVRFLLETARPDGSWPIDTNLATWVTTLSVNALNALPESRNPLTDADRRAIRDWLLGQQWTTEHPYTHAAPGGWAWTDLTGGVPDADDTPGALLALRNLGAADEAVRHAAGLGVRWLLGLQNPDGGIPTFCRGWGKLPFDRSSPDLTAHTLLAWKSWLPDLTPDLRGQVARAIQRATQYLMRVQEPDGSWIPLWFGNQHAPGEANRVYGVARVLAVLDRTSPPAQKALAWLLQAQNEDGGWGGCRGTPSSIEETSLALQALAQTPAREAVERGIGWLVRATDCGRSVQPAPIGLYFARLWYYEELYPLIFSIAALAHASPQKI